SNRGAKSRPSSWCPSHRPLATLRAAAAKELSRASDTVDDERRAQRERTHPVSRACCEPPRPWATLRRAFGCRMADTAPGVQLLPATLPDPIWRFVPAPFDAGSLAAIEPRFADLAARPLLLAEDLQR